MEKNYLTHGEKEFLLKLARTTLEKFLQSEEKYEPQTVNQKLWEKHGVFVSLYKGKELLGRAGLNSSDESILIAVRDSSLGAMRDAKLSSVDVGELGDIDIRITIVDDKEEVEFIESSF
jgi:AMMECR1 domain-containing protein